jgi:predicted ATPase
MVRLAAIEIINYKSLKSTGNLALKPITLLFGPNSSGKTSLIQILGLIKQTLENNELKLPLLINGKYVRTGGFQDLIYQHDKNNELIIKFSLVEEKHVYDYSFNIGPDSAGKIILKETLFQSMGYSIHYKNDKVVISFSGKPILYTSEMTFDHFVINLNLSELLTMAKSHAEMFAELAQLKSENEKTASSEEIRNKIDSLYNKAKHTRENLRIIMGGTEDMDGTISQLTDVNKLYEQFRNCLNSFMTQLYMIGPSRQSPKPFYMQEFDEIKNVGFEGEKTIPLLISSKPESTPTFDKIKYWLKKLNIAEDVEIKDFHQEIYSLKLVSPITNIDSYLINNGFGVSQILPIIVQAIIAKPGSFLIFEQPEVHLHPKLQMALTDFFIEMVKEGKQILLETHSEHILLRIQRRIAEKQITKDCIGIYYFELGKQGSEIEEVLLNEEGTLKRWPSGFFEEDTEDSFSMLRSM